MIPDNLLHSSLSEYQISYVMNSPIIKNINLYNNNIKTYIK